MRTSDRVRLPKNVPGPFYTLGSRFADGSGWCGDCLACEAPETEAPNLLAPLVNGNYDTYFIKQPRTRDEIEQACRAIEVCCVAALRYGGTDPAIIKRLGNKPENCDYILVADQLVYAGPPQTLPWWRRALRWLRSFFHKNPVAV
jgi:hypothetical protein